LEGDEFDRAKEDLDRAIGLNPKNASAYNTRGHTYLKKGDLDRSIEDFTEAINSIQKILSAISAGHCLFEQTRFGPGDRRLH
jgi:Tfp pilus assembly protein PilF